MNAAALTGLHRAPGDVAWTPPPLPDPGGVPVSRQDLFKVIAGAVVAGAPAPVRVELQEDLFQLDVLMADGDRAGVTLFAAMFGLPLPRESAMVVHHRRMARARLFGASSLRINTDDRDEDEPAGPRFFGGWAVSVNAYVPADPPACSPACQAEGRPDAGVHVLGCPRGAQLAKLANGAWR